jgi:lysophospholipase L1-like esterase
VALGSHDLAIREVGSHQAPATSNGITVDKAEVYSTGVVLIPHTNWTVQSVDSESFPGGNQPSYAENGKAINTFDDNPNTVWETQYLGSQPPPPHDLQINLGASYTVCGFRYLPRQVATHGHIGQYEFYVSQDPLNWGTPVATGSFANTAQEQEVLFTPKAGHYIRIRELTEVDGEIYAAIAELNALQAPLPSSQSPAVSIDLPATDVSIVAGDTIDFMASAGDPGGNLPLSYRWCFKPGSGVDDITSKNTGVVRFNTPGTFAATLTVANATGATTQVTRNITVMGASVLIPRNAWVLKSADSQDVSHPATAAFDGSTSTFWLTQSVAPQLPPHEIQIDLGGTYDIGGFRYLPRQDGSTVGRIGQYRFYVSSDGTNWGSPAAAGTFANNALQQEVLFASRLGRYVRLQATTEVNGQPYTAVADLNVLQAPIITPSVKLLQPRSFYLQTSNNLTVSVDTSFNSGQGIRFTIDGGPANGGAKFDVYNAPYQATFAGISTAPHTIDVYVIDAVGNLVTGVATHDQAVQVGVGDYYVAMGDSITYGIADDIHTDDTSQDGRTTGGGYEPPLADLLAPSVGRPVVLHNEGIGGDTSLDGVGQIQRLLQTHPAATRFLIMYGTNDAEASGFGLHPGDAGYAGSFKDNMQRIINDVKSAGKMPILAKVPAIIYDTTRDSQMQQFNMVVTELVADPTNGITISPPDFHTYFQNHPNEIADGIHPNGTGYQSMANLWFQVLH